MLSYLVYIPARHFSLFFLSGQEEVRTSESGNILMQTQCRGSANGHQRSLPLRVGFIPRITTQTLYGVVFDDSEEGYLCRACKPRTQSGPALLNPGSHHALSSHTGLVLQGEGNTGKDIEVTSLLGKLHWDLFKLFLDSSH